MDQTWGILSLGGANNGKSNASNFVLHGAPESSPKGPPPNRFFSDEKRHGYFVLQLKHYTSEMIKTLMLKILSCMGTQTVATKGPLMCPI